MKMIIVVLLVLPVLCSCGPVITHSIEPNFTASYFEFIDQSGDFLVSLNSTFKAAIHNLKGQDSTLYYLSVKHVASDTVIWSANPSRPVSSSDTLSLTPGGLSLGEVWSTPGLASPAAALLLMDSGNLCLVSAAAVTLWQSFDHPTDTLVPSQLVTSISSGGYRLSVTPHDAVLLWRGIPYWKLSMQTYAYTESTLPASFIAVNNSGLYLLAADKSSAVIRVRFSASQTQIAGSLTALKLGTDGKLSAATTTTQGSNNDNAILNHLSAPAHNCRVPLWCGTLRVCDPTSCFCPSGFVPKGEASCFPANNSLSLPSASTCSSRVSYMPLGDDIDYFANDFTAPATQSLDLAGCQDMCSRNCSCLAIFHHNLSGSCYLITQQLGSLMHSSSASASARSGYIKAIVAPPSRGPRQHEGFPVAALVLLPTTSLFVVVGVALLVTIWVKRKRDFAGKPRRWNSSSSEEDEEVMSIPGLPVRFSYQQLADATDNFKNQIGSGGFGTVYKGTLPDNTAIAVKKMSGVGVREKKDFCAEVSIIGNIHHLNLVRLKGFCVEGRQRFLVMEFMNRGSLDAALFADNGPPLEWKERVEIALGTARGLAYLHSGCDQKIIHCDVKPENILLHHNSQAKISDFGLSKLVTTEQSSLFTTMRGTRGYLAPEWLTNSSITEKADVYSYGMVLMEIMRGKKNSWWEAGAVYFPLMAVEMHEQGIYSELGDPRLQGRVAEEELAKAAKIALCCVHEDPLLRPTMSAVVGMWEGLLPLPDPCLHSLNFLRFYGRRFTDSSQQNKEFVMWDSGATTSSSSYISSNQLSAPR